VTEDRYNERKEKEKEERKRKQKGNSSYREFSQDSFQEFWRA
jgi:hypothetical protein